MATLANQVRADRGKPPLTAIEFEDNAKSRPFYQAGALAAFAVIALVFVNGLVLMANPIPSTVLGHFEQIRGNSFVGLINLDGVMLLSEILLSAVYVALFIALRRAAQAATAIGAGIGLAGVLLYVAVNPTLSFLYLTDQYAAASSDAQRAAFLAAGEAIWANYQGTAFGVAYMMSGVATLVLAIVMLRSHVFSRWTAYMGLLFGSTMLVPPLPALGTPAVVVSFVSLLPMMVWEGLIGWRLLRLSRSRRPVPVRAGAA